MPDPYISDVMAELAQVKRDRDRMYQRALDAESHAAFGPMDVDERVRLLRTLAENLEAERDEMRAEVERERKRADDAVADLRALVVEQGAEVERLREAIRAALEAGTWPESHAILAAALDITALPPNTSV